MDYCTPAIDIARRAGHMLREHLHETRHIENKGTLNNLVTEMDKRSEALIAGALREAFPAHDVLGEEGTRAAADRPADLCWHVDPIDGTNNYIHRFPWFGVSLGLVRREDARPVAGVIYHVMLDEMYWAAEGQGAWLNGERIHVSEVSTLTDSMLATGFPYWIHQERETIIANLEAMLVVSQGVRRPGVASLDLASVACGRFDGYWEESLGTWDVAAGIVLVREAGGRVTDYDGAPAALPHRHIVASNGRVHEPMVDIVRGRYRGSTQRSEGSMK